MSRFTDYEYRSPNSPYSPYDEYDDWKNTQVPDDFYEEAMKPHLTSYDGRYIGFDVGCGDYQVFDTYKQRTAVIEDYRFEIMCRDVKGGLDTPSYLSRMADWYPCSQAQMDDFIRSLMQRLHATEYRTRAEQKARRFEQERLEEERRLEVIRREQERENARLKEISQERDRFFSVVHDITRGEENVHAILISHLKVDELKGTSVNYWTEQWIKAETFRNNCPLRGSEISLVVSQFCGGNVKKFLKLVKDKDAEMVMWLRRYKLSHAGIANRAMDLSPGVDPFYG